MHTESFRNEMRRRRPRRYSVVTALASRGASALQAWLWLLVFIFQNEFRISDSIQPGYLDFDNLPDTNFTCAGKVIGGYYADLETSCQMFHVCTVGQADEPMDIKFLCLNGTVFDQETRVCERVDEVDCTKSEKFYSLNLELYGSTVAPVVEHERDKSHEQSHEQSHDRKPVQTTSSTTTTTAPPVPSSDPPRHHLDHNNHQTEHVEPAEENQEPEEEEEDLEDEEYEDYTPTPAHTTTSFQPATTGVPFTTQPPTTPPTSTTSAPLPTYGVPSDPSLLSPHEFTYQHTRPAASPAAAPAVPPPALSFQRQSYPQHAQPPRLTLTAHRTAAPPPASTPPPNPPPRPADHVYITAEPHHYSEIEQIDHYELYESSKNAPRRPHDRPAPFLPSHVSRTPQGFRPPPTATPPRSQLQSPGQYESRPVQSYQPSERHEILYEDRYRQPPLPAPTYDYDRFHYDRKRSHETEPSIEDELPIARSVSSTSPVPAVSSTREPPTQRPTLRVVPKSPPRVIVTASASVSDSNGKKLNYTVGNVVRAVKPIVPINYDDYKESDLIFDPFFLDVPKLSRRRKTSGSTGHDLGKRNVVITLQQIAAAPLASPPSQVVLKVTTTTPGWLPPDYVDDNYEPNAYVELPQYVKQNHSLPEENDLKKKVLKTVVSSQSPAVASATTTATAKLGGGDGADPEKGMWRLSARWPAVMRPLLAALPPPGGGDFKVVSAGSAASSKSSFSCEGRKLYELFADAKDCGAFHVCAEGGLHVRLRCARGLRYRASARACARPARGEPACDDPLGDV